MKRWRSEQELEIESLWEVADQVYDIVHASLKSTPVISVPMSWVIASRDANLENDEPILSFWSFPQEDKNKMIYALDSGVDIGMNKVPIAAFFFICQEKDGKREFIRIVGTSFAQELLLIEINFERNKSGYIKPFWPPKKLYHPHVTKRFLPSDRKSGNPAQFTVLDDFLVGYVEAVHYAKYGYHIDKADPTKYIEGRAL